MNIPTLCVQELTQVAQQHSGLATLMTAAPRPLQELLHLPFNLRLLAELLTAGNRPEDLHPIQTQIDLLDRYWQERIIRHDGNGDARELVLQRTTDAMVQQRALRIPRSAARANDSASSPHLNDLLSNHVLAEWTTRAGTTQRDFLTFPHHLLFDYAVARLTIPQEPQALTDRLATESDLLIAIRPSIELHYQRIWHHDPDRFWDLTFTVMSATVPENGKLLGPSVAAVTASTNDQFLPLIKQVQQPGAVHDQGMIALRHVLATLVTNATTASGIGSLWCNLLDTVTAVMTLDLAFTVRPSLRFLAERIGTLSADASSCLGRIARRLLTYALSNISDDPGFLVTGIATVNMTAHTAPVDSVQLLRSCITPEHLQQFGYRTLSTLADGVPTLVTINPAYVSDLYLAALRHRDASTSTTMIYESRIMSFTSNRQQDYNHGLWQLGQHYQEFLRRAPTDAIRTLLNALQHDEHQRAHNQQALPVQFNDVQTGLIPDNSGIWDTGISNHELPIKMLDALQTFLIAHATEDVTGILLTLIGTAAPGVVWRRLLVAGSQQPTGLGYILRSLAWDYTILTARDSTIPAGDFLRVIHATLPNDDRERIENTILSIATRRVPADIAAHNRDRLLACLNPSAFVTAQARDEHSRMLASSRMPSNTDDNDVQRGIPHQTASTASRELLALLRPVAVFAEQSLSQPPTTAAINDVLPHLQALSDAISRPTDGALTPTFANEALSALARACLAIAYNDALTGEQLAPLLPILLRGASDEHPKPSEDQDQTTKVTAWDNRSPRIPSAEAIILLARYQAWCTTEVQALINQLGKDTVPVVRAQIACRLTCLCKTAPNLMWALLEHYAHEDPNPTVIIDALHTLQQIPVEDAGRTASLTISILDRTAGTPDSEEIRDGCINILASLALSANEPQSTTFVDAMIAEPLTHAHDLYRFTHFVATRLPMPDQRVTNATLALLEQGFTGVVKALRSLEAEHQHQAPPPAVQAQYDELLHCAGELAMRLQFALQALQDAKAEQEVIARETFYRQVKPLLVMLADIGHPHIAHSVLEALEAVIALDPPGVLVLVAHVCTAGSKYGYQYEKLATDLMVKIIDQYLAQYRTIFREHPECTAALMEALDVFVRVGWPSAHRLAYRLNEIYQ